MVVRALALAASVLLLAGCAAPPMPEPLTEAEVKQRMADDAAMWWESMFPDEPQPVIEPIEYVDPDDPRGADPTVECMKRAEREGTDFSEDLQWYICSQQYPYRPDAANSGYLSDDELAWIWDYNRERLVPCLQLLGYPVLNRSADYAEGSNSYWVPYYEMGRVPTAQEWIRIDLRCPPSPVGPNYRPSQG